MLTVAEAARRAGKNPETIRRWIRAGKLPSRRIGLQHLIDERDLDDVANGEDEWLSLPVPESWGDAPHLDYAKLVRRAREGR